MSIEILERGTPPGEKSYEATCAGCQSKLKFLRGDGMLTNDWRDGDYLTVICPVCNSPVHKAA